MSEPEWIGPGSDYLEEKFGSEAGDYLRAAPAKLDLLERAVVALESYLATRFTHQYQWQLQRAAHRVSEVIAEARGETPEETLARLNPSPRFVSTDGRIAITPEHPTHGPPGTTIDFRPLSNLGVVPSEPVQLTSDGLLPLVEMTNANPVDFFSSQVAANRPISPASSTIDRWIADHPGFDIEMECAADISPPSLTLRMRSPDRMRDAERMIGESQLIHLRNADQHAELILGTLDEMHAEITRPVSESDVPVDIQIGNRLYRDVRVTGFTMDDRTT